MGEWKRDIIERGFGGRLTEYVAVRRSLGVSWSRIAREVSVRSGTPVTPESIQRWAPTPATAGGDQS